MINTTKFPPELLHHDNLSELSSHSQLTGDRRHLRDFIDADYFRWGVISTLCLGRTSSTNANIFLIWGQS